MEFIAGMFFTLLSLVVIWFVWTIYTNHKRRKETRGAYVPMGESRPVKDFDPTDKR